MQREKIKECKIEEQRGEEKELGLLQKEEIQQHEMRK